MASLRSKNVLFGGAGDRGGTFGAFDETWEWDGTSWSVRKVPGPPARWAFAMATLNDKVVLFGGFDGQHVFGDTWEWNGTSWTQRMVQGPPGRNRHAMATVKGKVLLFGGQTEHDSFRDTWEWDGNVWTERDVSPAPPMSTGHAMAALRGKAVLFGGATVGPTYSLETWEWDGRAWTERKVDGPSARATPAMAAWQGEIVLFGGVVLRGGSTYVELADTWEWNGNNWTELDVSGPIGVSDAAMSSR
jgi:N-acetylneuraminic acid mutarotase